MRETKTEAQTDKEKQTDKHSERDRQTNRQTDRQTDRQTETERDRELLLCRQITVVASIPQNFVFVCIQFQGLKLRHGSLKVFYISLNKKFTMPGNLTCRKLAILRTSLAVASLMTSSVLYKMSRSI